MQMKKTYLILTALLAISTLAAPPARANEWKFPVGLTYSQGFTNAVDFYEAQVGFDSDFAFPIGIAFTPFYQWDHGSRLGMDVGPIGLILMSLSSSGSSNYQADYSFWDIPVAVTYGFSFLPKKNTSPYLRVGPRYHIASGDFVDSSSIGWYGAFGVDFLQTKKVGVEAEIGYDSSTMKLSGPFSQEEIKSGELQVSVRVVF